MLSCEIFYLHQEVLRSVVFVCLFVRLFVNTIQPLAEMSGGRWAGGRWAGVVRAWRRLRPRSVFLVIKYFLRPQNYNSITAVC